MHDLDNLPSMRDICFFVWNQHKPKTFRQAEAMIGKQEAIEKSTLQTYFSNWNQSNGTQRRYRKRGERKDE